MNELYERQPVLVMLRPEPTPRYVLVAQGVGQEAPVVAIWVERGNEAREGDPQNR